MRSRTYLPAYILDCYGHGYGCHLQHILVSNSTDCSLPNRPSKFAVTTPLPVFPCPEAKNPAAGSSLCHYHYFPLSIQPSIHITQYQLSPPFTGRCARTLIVTLAQREQTSVQVLGSSPRHLVTTTSRRRVDPYGPHPLDQGGRLLSPAVSQTSQPRSSNPHRPACFLIGLN